MKTSNDARQKKNRSGENTQRSFSSIILSNVGIPVIPLVAAVLGLWILLEYFNFVQATSTIKNVSLQEQQARIEEELNGIVTLVNERISALEEKNHRELADHGIRAFNVLMSLYRQWQGIVSRAELEKLCIEALRPLRFNDNRGYFFVLTFTGLSRLHADNPSIEGSDLFDFVDSQGTFPVRSMIEVAKGQGQGFVDYTYNHPNRTGNDHRKTAFVIAFEPFDWVIGIGEYFDDLDRVLKTEILDLIDKIGFGADGYIFINDSEGNLLANSALSGTRDFFGQKASSEGNRATLDKMSEVARSAPGGGWLTYEWIQPSTGTDGPKMSFVRYIERWQWVIGTGLYPDAMDNVISGLTIDLQYKLIGKIVALVGVLLLIFGTMALLLRGVARKVGAQVAIFSDFFDKAFRERIEIPGESIAITEFSHIASAANEMVRKQRSVLNDLRESENRYRSLFEASNDAVIIHDPEGTVLETNERARRLFRRESGSGKMTHRLSDLFPDESSAALFDYLAALARNGSNRMEASVRAPDSSELFMDLTSNVVEREAGLSQTIMRDITASVHNRKRVELLNEELSKTVDARTVELMQSQEQLLNTRLQMLEKEKMAGLGELVGGVTHEINTPLGIGITLSSMIAERAVTIGRSADSGSLTREALRDFLETARESSDIVLQNLQRAAELTASLKTIAVDQMTANRRAFVLKEYLAKIVTSMQVRMRKTGHRLLWDCPPTPMLKGNPGVLYQIIANLTNNSLIHGFENKEKGTIRITVTEQEQTVTIRFHDDGKGMDSETRTHIFEPFFTTKRDLGGTGLGLHIVKTLVFEEFGGTIDLETAPGSGTAFIILLPIHRPGPAEGDAVQPFLL